MANPEQEAFFTLIAEERDRIANVVSSEHRPHTEDELNRLVFLDQAMTALINADRRQNPPAPPAPAGGLAPIGSDYRYVAEKQHASLVEQAKFAMHMVGEYGKWLVATISAVHLGGIFFIGSLEGVSLAAKEPALWALVAGMMLILASGFVAYGNWGYNAQLLYRWAHPDMLVDPKKWPTNDPLQSRIQATFVAAIALGILSVIAMPIAAALLSLAA